MARSEARALTSTHGEQQNQPFRSLRSGRWNPLLIFLGGLALYVVTLAPTVLWGDDAELQRLAWSGGETSMGRGHELWLAIARAFVLLPWGDPARRANLVSAVFAALTLPFVYQAVLCVSGSRLAGSLGATALGISHTFWLHAVRAEVYSLHLCFLAATIWLMLVWSEEPDRLALLAGGASLAGLSTLNHLHIATQIPALVWLLWRCARAPRWRPWTLAGMAFTLGAIPYLAMVASPATGGLLRGFASVFRPLPLSGRDTALWAGFLGYQFPTGVLLAPLGLAWLWRHRRSAAQFLILSYLGSVALAIGYRAQDQYVFYLPSYLIVSICTGVGCAVLVCWRPSLARLPRLAALVLLLFAVPITLYRLMPAALTALDLNPLSVRSLPGRDPNEFFLWPPKRGYLGARRYGEEVLSTLPPDAVLLADWSLLECLEYLQTVEGWRPDVTLIQIYAGKGRQVPYLLQQSATRPVLIAGILDYYDTDQIRSHFDILPLGPVYLLERLP